MSLLKETIGSSFIIDKEALFLLVDFAYTGILQTKKVYLVSPIIYEYWPIEISKVYLILSLCPKETLHYLFTHYVCT